MYDDPNGQNVRKACDPRVVVMRLWGRHGKMSTRGAARTRRNATLKKIAKARPGGEAARSLKARDIKKWKKNR